MTQGVCPPCGRPAGSSCDACLAGDPPAEKLAYDRLRAGGACVRGCVQWRQHWDGCKEEKCPGCKPREAKFGRLCERCHHRLAAWLGDGPGALVWVHGWLIADLEPAQAGGFDQFGKKRGKPAPPAALNLHVYSIRAEIEVLLGQWLIWLVERFNLHGPDWFRHRMEHGKTWPHTDMELQSAQQYLLTWIDRIETHEDFLTHLFDHADRLVKAARAIAPWEPRAQRLKNDKGVSLECPNCSRDALVRFEGDEHLTCRRCDELVGREKYDRWAFMLTAEKQEGEVA